MAEIKIPQTVDVITEYGPSAPEKLQKLAVRLNEVTEYAIDLQKQIKELREKLKD